MTTRPGASPVASTIEICNLREVESPVRKFLHPSRLMKKASDAAPVIIPSLIESLECRRLLSTAAPIYDTETVVPLPSGTQVNSIAADEFKEVAVNLGGLFYYSPFWAFADALKMESRGFMQNAARDNNNTRVANSNLDSKGYVIPAGTYNAKPFQNSFHPTGAPTGLYTVTWTGDGLVTLRKSNGDEITPVEVGDHRRVYRVTDGRVRIQVDNVASGGNYVRDIHAWMPDPDAPDLRSLEPTVDNPDPFWHPQYLAHLQEIAAKSGYFRYMDWLATNSSPQVNWSDRRPADHAFANGNTNYKQLNVPGISDPTKYGEIGVAWEWIIDLSNRLNVNPWINIPHAATDEYVRNVADMFAGRVPGQAGLNPGLKVYLEHSNEIWSSGSSFAQGDWATQQSQSQSITKPAFNGRRAAEVFRIFDQQFKEAGPAGDIDRSADVVRIAATFAGQDYYTKTYLAGMSDRADDFVDEPNYMGHVIATTSYFGNTSYVKHLFNELDWLNVQYGNPSDAVINQAIDDWINKFSLNTNSFTNGVTQKYAAQYGIKYLAYEGGPSLYTHGQFVYIKDGKIVDASVPGATRNYSLSEYVKQNYPDDDSTTSNNDRFTKFIEEINRNPRMAEVYAAQLQIQKARNLKTHAAFQDLSPWNRNGQWGHKEYLGQTSGYAYGDAVKWQYLLDYAEEEAIIRDVDAPINNVPVLPPISTIGSIYTGDSFTYDINAISLGDVAIPANANFKLVGGFVPAGMSLTRLDDDTMRLSGAPIKPGTYRMMIRLTDDDQDPAYSIYTLEVAGGELTSKGIVVTEDAYAIQNSPDTTISGSDEQIIAGTGARVGYLKFDLTNSIPGELDSAKLRVYVRGFEGTSTPTLRLLYLEKTSDYLKLPSGEPQQQWTEDNLEYRYAPNSATFIGTVQTLSTTPAGWVEFDVTSYLREAATLSESDPFVSFAVRGVLQNAGPLDAGIILASKEYAGGDFAPQLILNSSVVDSLEPLRADVVPVVPNPRTSALNTASVTFNRAINGFDASDVILTKNGQPVTINPANLNITTNNNTTFSISGLSAYTAGSGGYALKIKVDGSGIASFVDATDVLKASDAESWSMTAPTSVVGRHVFYNNSYFDGNNATANSSDNAAIATDKVALRPGQGKATFANYTSYAKGINGIIIDLANLPTGSLSEEDLAFRVGNAATPSSMSALLTMPEITIRHGAGANGSDRITLTWPDGTIKNTWLEVTLKATSNTGLATADVFYFGNVIGETGNSGTDTYVDGIDTLGVRNNPRNFLNRAPVTFKYDFNRDSFVDGIDTLLVRNNATNFLNSLKLIVV